MKKLISLIMVLLFIPVAFAQTTEEAAGITPDSPWYFADEIGDNLKVTFAAGEQAKNEARLDIAEEKLAEYKLMEKKEKPDAAIKAMVSHNKRLQEIEESPMTERQKIHLQERLMKHIMVLERVRMQVPEQAKLSIDKALQKSSMILEKAQESLPEEDVIGEEELRAALEPKLQKSFATEEEREFQKKIDSTIGNEVKPTLERYEEADEIEHNYKDRWEKEPPVWTER